MASCCAACTKVSAGELGRQVGAQQVVEVRAGAAAIGDRVAERDVRADLGVGGKERSGVAAGAAGGIAAAAGAAAGAAGAARATDVSGAAATAGEE